MPRPRAAELAAPPGEASVAVRGRVAGARERLWESLPRRTEEASELLSSAVERLPLSGRGRVRVARVARTIAALAGSDAVEPAHVAEAHDTLTHATIPLIFIVALAQLLFAWNIVQTLRGKGGPYTAAQAEPAGAPAA